MLLRFIIFLDVIMHIVVPSLFDYVLNLTVWKSESERAVEKWFLCRINVVAVCFYYYQKLNGIILHFLNFF